MIWGWFIIAFNMVYLINHDNPRNIMESWVQFMSYLYTVLSKNCGSKRIESYTFWYIINLYHDTIHRMLKFGVSTSRPQVAGGWEHGIGCLKTVGIWGRHGTNNHTLWSVKPSKIMDLFANKKSWREFWKPTEMGHLTSEREIYYGLLWFFINTDGEIHQQSYEDIRIPCKNKRTGYDIMGYLWYLFMWITIINGY